MEKTYKEIVRIIKKIGTKSTLDKVPVKVIDMQNGVLVLEPTSGWLALRRKLTSKNEFTNRTETIYYNEVKYKDSGTPYCLLPELKELLNQIVG